MSVLVEAISVVVRFEAIERLYPGGWAELERNPPNKTLCCDRKIARVGFMTPADVGEYVRALEGRGFVFIEDGKFVDIAVIDQQQGFTMPCNWLELRRVPLDNDLEKMITICRVSGEDMNHTEAPDGWRYEESLSSKFSFVPTEQADNRLEFLRSEDGLEIYWDHVENKEVYVGRSGHEPHKPISKRRAKIN